MHSSLNLINNLPAAESQVDPAGELLSGKDGVSGLGSEVFRGYSPFLARIKDHKVGGISLHGADGLKADDLGRNCGHFCHQLRKAQVAGLHQMGDAGGKGGLQTHHAAGGIRQSLCLFLGAVGGMVGDDAVKGSVQNSFQDGGLVGIGAQGGIHPGKSALGEDLIFGIDEILGAGLSSDGDAVFLGLTDQVGGACGGDMGNMHMAIGILGQHRPSAPRSQRRWGRPGRSPRSPLF